MNEKCDRCGDELQDWEVCWTDGGDALCDTCYFEWFINNNYQIEDD